MQNTNEFIPAKFVYSGDRSKGLQVLGPCRYPIELECIILNVEKDDWVYLL